MTTTPTRGLDTRALVPFVAVALPVGWVLLSIPLVADLPDRALRAGHPAPRPRRPRPAPDPSRPRHHHPRAAPRLLARAAPAGAAAGPLGHPRHDLGRGRPERLRRRRRCHRPGSPSTSSPASSSSTSGRRWCGPDSSRGAPPRACGFVRGAVLTAALFAGIHLPLAFYGVDGAADVLVNVAIMVAAGIGMRLLIGALDLWGRGSILAVAVLHASFNATGDLVARRPRLDQLRRHARLRARRPSPSRPSAAGPSPRSSADDRRGPALLRLHRRRRAAATRPGSSWARSLSDPQMLAIAQAIGYSETAFLSPVRRTGRLGDPVLQPPRRGRLLRPRHRRVRRGHRRARRRRDAVPGDQRRAGAGLAHAVDTAGTVTATLTSPATSTVDPSRRRAPGGRGAGCPAPGSRRPRPERFRCTWRSPATSTWWSA